MVQVVHGGAEVFDSILYGKIHPGTQSFLENQVNTINYSTALTDAGKRFFQGARELFERTAGSTAARIARAAGRHVRSLWQTDDIRELTDLRSLQTAPMTMQRWIMAQPNVRERFLKQACDGFSDTYVNVHGNAIGQDHYDYRRVMNGVVELIDDDEGEYDWSATTFMEELLPEDEELSLDEQVDIHTSWANVVSYLRAGKEDPTSRWDADL